MSVFSRSARRGGVIFAVLALVLGAVAMASPAGAATLSAPTNLAPVSGGANAPTLSWDRVSGATNYSVQISAASDFSSLAWSSTTINKAAVPTVNLPAGQLYWRVRAQAGSTLSAWSQGGFTHSALTVPSGLSPSNGTVFPQPTQAARVAWQPVSGATGYTVQIANDAGFTFVVNTFTTKSTSVVARNLLNKAYYWRVRANYSTTLSSAYSASRSFVFGTLPKPAVVSPTNGSTVDEPILAWAPVPGAVTYELQVSTSASFSSTLVSQKGIYASTYAPGQGFAKGKYYWRVRPFDSVGKGLDWADVDVWSFTRGWSAQPGLQYPANGASVAEPMFFQWTPARQAESYLLELSTSSSFSSIYDSCTTVHVTYVPNGPGDCWPAAGGHYYWRVVGVDGPAPLGGSSAQQTNRGSAQVRSFTYSPARPVMTAPLSGSVQVPTFRWNPVYGAAQYRVTISGPTNLTVTTNTTSFTPRSVLANGSYKWQVRSVSRTGEVGPAYSWGEQPSFAVASQSAPIATVPDPTVGNQTAGRFPTLTWSPVLNATSYKIQVRATSTSTWTTLPDSYAYPAGDDTASTWAPGSYQWRVTAYNGAIALTTSATLGTFTVSEIGSVTGQQVALNGTATSSDATSCTKALSGKCNSLRETPVLAWSVDPEAVYYHVFLATNSALSQPVSGYPKVVDNIRDLVTEELADRTGGSAYYWAVQACRTSGDCSTVGSATNAFKQVSKPIQLLTPATDDTVYEQAITLTWRELGETNQDTSYATPTDNSGVPAATEASQYRVQVASDSGFANLMSDAVVNHTQYTAPTTLYPQGTYYWRVQATDGSGNTSRWSASRPFTKKTPLVSLGTPADGSTVSGSVALVWDAQPSAASYDMELYKNASAPVKITTFHTSIPAYVPSTTLAVSSQPYAWRVRPIDAKGDIGRWSPMATFTVTGSAPSLSSPADGVMLPADEGLFAWTAVPGAAKYRWERRDANTGSVAQRVVTFATTFAPPAKIGTGNWEWRVVALDTASRPLGISGWRGFLVDVTGPRVKTYSPTGKVSLNTNFKVTFNEPVTNLTNATFTITASGGSNALAASVSLDSTKKVATLNPGSTLKSGKKYVVRLTSGVTDVHGNPMTPFSWTITGK